MVKADLVAVLADELEVSRKKAEAALNSVLEAVAVELQKGEKVVISGFGTFEVRTRVARSGRNPRTGETITVPEQKTPAFRAGKQLKERVDKK
ncbi:MAG: HU family DNA-binding protein [Acholeplasmatales bacterium]|nr:HU family DNA-binding protein [Acholeplasmatales bacterium]